MAEKRETPPKYKQPVTEFVGRNLTGSLEQIDYSPKSHIRIWYNNQVEGYATHHHTAMEMILCIENTYTVIANNKTYHLNVGDILLIPPNMLHKIIWRGICQFSSGFSDASFPFSGVVSQSGRLSYT